MTEAKQAHPEFQKWEQLLDNLNVWENPDELEEATTRRSIEIEVIEKAFSDDTGIELGHDIEESDIDPTRFQSAERVEIERMEDDILGRTFRLSAEITDLNPNPQQRLTLLFEGYVSEQNGLETKRPVLIRRG